MGMAAGKRQLGARWAVFAVLLIVTIGVLGPGVAGAQEGNAGVFSEEDLPALVLTEDDEVQGAQYSDSEFLDLQGSLPQRYDALIEAGAQEVYRARFYVGDDSLFPEADLFSHALLFPSEAQASRAVPLLNPGAPGEPLSVGEDGLLWGDVADPTFQVGWRRSNVVLELLYVSTRNQPLEADALALTEMVDARVVARMPEPETETGDTAAGQPEGYLFTEDDLAAIVLGEEDAPEGAAITDSGRVEMSQLDQGYAPIFAELRGAGLQALHQACFDPWAGSQSVCSQVLLFPGGSEASSGLELLTLTENLDLGDEGGWGASGSGDVLEAVWRRSNALLWLTVHDQGPEPSISFEEDAVPLARQMDDKAVALASGEDGLGSWLPWIAAALAVLVALALGALWLRTRSRRLAPAASDPAATAPSEPAVVTAAGSAEPSAAQAEAAPAPSPPPREDAAPQTKYCRNCGTPHPAEASFCGSCGTPFD